ncbi:cytochrome P450 [Rhodococcoides fascians]|uniref:cytochrome P450 n=1 Tax=Rhodococcoides fascians TaxID=1828 RepID=UPI00050C73FB|nr:cytochrome P450 [Rhodococcus fascians]
MTAQTSIPTSNIDLYEDASLLDPLPLWSRLRESGSAVWMERHQAWAVSRYADVEDVLGSWERFSSYPNPGLVPDREGMPQGGLLGSDPPAHTELREVLKEQVSPRALRSLADSIAARADTFVSEVVAQGTFDAVTALAQPFPVQVVADLVGLPQDGRENLLTLADAAFNSFGPTNERTLATQPYAGVIMQEYIPTVMNRETLAPGSWGAAVYDAVDAGRMDEYDAPQLLSAFVVAGMDTTIHTIASAVGLLADRPDVLADIRRDLAVARKVFEETVRLESPVMQFSRRATCATHIGEVPIAEGDRVIVMFASANRDERHFEAADRFDPYRESTGHLGFGYGVHSCVGQGLARIEGASILAALARRVDRIDVVGEPVRHLNNAIRGLDRLPVSVTRIDTEE